MRITTCMKYHADNQPVNLVDTDPVPMGTVENPTDGAPFRIFYEQTQIPPPFEKIPLSLMPYLCPNSSNTSAAAVLTSSS